MEIQVNFRNDGICPTKAIPLKVYIWRGTMAADNADSTSNMSLESIFDRRFRGIVCLQPALSYSLFDPHPPSPAFSEYFLKSD